MGMGMLFAGALTGGANAVGQLADNAIQQRDRQAEQQSTIMARRSELLLEMKAKADMARQADEAEFANKERARTDRRDAIAGRVDANAEQALSQRYAEPIMGDVPMSQEQQAVMDDGLRRQRIERERDKLRFKRDPEQMTRAAVEEGFENPAVLMQNETKQQLAQMRADGEASKQAQAIELALAKMEAKAGNRAPSGYRETADGNLEAIPGGPADPSVKEASGKPMPASAAKSYLENLANLRRAKQTLELAQGKELPGGIKGDAAATGLKGLIPNQVLNRIDPAGVETRAAIADLGSMVIHDRSGAAVTAAEFPRLAPFIPSPTDDAETVQKKLRQFVSSYEAVIADHAEFYQEQGYKVPAQGLRSGAQGTEQRPPDGGAPRINSRAELEALPSGSLFTAPDGSVRVKP